MQSKTISSLVERLNALEEEQLNLEKQIKVAEQKYHEQREALIARYINTESTLAQMEFIMPVKRARLGKSHSTYTDSRVPSCLAAKQFLNPATNLVYHKMHCTTRDAQTKLRQSNEDILAWKFSPESAIGKHLMSRIRHLLSANEELGRVKEADRVAALESDATTQRTCMKEFIKTNEGIETVLEEAYVDLEDLQRSLLTVHQQINQAESLVETLQNELESRQPGKVAELMAEILLKMSNADDDEIKSENDEVETNVITTDDHVARNTDVEDEMGEQCDDE